jgi:hypothetical protein
MKDKTFRFQVVDSTKVQGPLGKDLATGEMLWVGVVRVVEPL